MTYIERYNVLKDGLEGLGYNVYPMEMSGRTTPSYPYGEIYIYNPSAISATAGKSHITRYRAQIRILEQIRSFDETESDITLIPRRNGERDANIRAFLEIAGLTNCTLKYRVGFGGKGSSAQTLITIIEGDI